MKTVVLLYETCCIYEIVITSYFLQYSGHELVFATPDGAPVTAKEKFSLKSFLSGLGIRKCDMRFKGY